MKASLRDGRQVAALTVAGSDSGGNAGVQADVRAFHAFGLHACTVFASLTAQNPSGVSAVHVPPVEFLAAQLDAVLPAYSLGAAKTGMLATAEVVACVAEKFRARPDLPLVVDPVMVATSGAKLLRDDAVAAVRDLLLPLAAVSTPNLPEAEALSGRAVRGRADMAAAARALADASGRAVLVKGGHATGDLAEDVLAAPDGLWLFSAPVVRDPVSTHGTGCSLSAALAAAIALGRPLPEAVRAAKAYVWEAIRSGVAVGPDAGVLGMPDPGVDFFDHPFIRCERI